MGVTTAAHPSLPENCPKSPLDIGYNSAILVPMTTTAQKKTYPTLAEIVREETDGGRLIVRFYLGVASGALDGFEACHRAAAARQVHKLAPHLVEEYLAKYAGAPCDHGKKARKGRRRARPAPAKLYPDRVKLEDLHDCPVHMAPGASVFQRRLALAIQKETGNGAEIIDFMIDVMCGDIPGFKACHRIEAAREMAGYIIRDEERSTARIPWPADPFESARPPNRNRPPNKGKARGANLRHSGESRNPEWRGRGCGNPARTQRGRRSRSLIRRYRGHRNRRSRLPLRRSREGGNPSRPRRGANQGHQARAHQRWPERRSP